MKKGFRYGWIGLVLLFMYAPILILAVYSFTDAANIGPFRSFSVHNYVTLFTTPELLNMILGSVILAVGSGLIATILGTSGAIGAFYSKKRVKTAMSALNQVPVVNADVVTGFSMCILLVVVFGVSKDTYIPLVLGIFGVLLCSIWVLATCTLSTGQDIALAVFTAIVQGVLIAGLSTYVNQFIKQMKKDE